MITISPFFIIPIFIAAAAISAWQHARIPHMNPLASRQFWMIIFCMAMMLVVNFLDRRNPNPWLTVLFLLIAVATLLFVLRQNRMVPPRDRR